MSIIYECDGCGYQEKAGEYTVSTGPKEWSSVVLNINTLGTNQKGFKRLFCPTCATKYGVTMVATKEITDEEKLSDYFYNICAELVDEAMENN